MKNALLIKLLVFTLLFINIIQSKAQFTTGNLNYTNSNIGIGFASPTTFSDRLVVNGNIRLHNTATIASDVYETPDNYAPLLKIMGQDFAGGGSAVYAGSIRIRGGFANTTGTGGKGGDVTIQGGDGSNTGGGHGGHVFINPGYGYSYTGSVYLASQRGTVIIGTSSSVSPNYKLAVGGRVVCEELNVKLQDLGWPDYVFENNYSLKGINEVEQYVKNHKHLPEIPSAEFIKNNGVSVGEMQVLQMKKLEEMMLYIIQLKKENELLAKKVSALESK